MGCWAHTWYGSLGTGVGHWILGTGHWVLNSRYLVLGREGRSEAARTRGGGQPGVLYDDHDDEGGEVKMPGENIPQIICRRMVGFYLDKVKAVKGCGQALLCERITPADVLLQAIHSENSFL